jgi:YD repeat-containing protein
MIFNRYLLCVTVFVGTSAAQAVYTYDSGGHLTGVSFGAAGSVAYNYDAAGNLIGRSLATAASAVITSVKTASGSCA